MAIRFIIPGSVNNPDLPMIDVEGFTDTFARSNSSTLGKTEYPARAWVVEPSATVQGIAGGAAFVARSGTLGPTLAAADAGSADGEIAATLGAWVENYTGIAFRVSTITDYWRFAQNGSVYRLEKVVDGTTSVIDTVAGSSAPGGVLSVTMNGSSITCKADGVAIISTTSTDLQAATRHGIYNSGSTGNTIRDIKFTA